MKTQLLILAIALMGFNAKAQQPRYNYRSPEADYYQAFNDHTKRLYGNTRAVQSLAYGVMQGSRNIPGAGKVRAAYSAANSAVKRLPISLPRYYQYNPNGGNRRR